jgi:protein SCO1/2
MVTRTRYLSYVVLCLAIAAGLGAALIARQASRELPALAGGSLIEPNTRVPDFSLLDHHGKPFTNANLIDRWSMLYFGYTNCPDFCPATLGTLAAMERRMRATGAPLVPQVVFVSADALRDTPAQLASYVPYFDAGFLGVTAPDQAAIETFANALGVAVAINRGSDGRYTVDHSSAILVIDPKGRLDAVLTGPFTAPAIEADFRLITGQYARLNGRS